MKSSSSVWYNPILASGNFPVIPYEQHNVEELWRESMPDLNPPDHLAQYYSEPQRYYHNMYHISRLLKTYDGNNQIMILAIWFHDIIYEPKNKDNEIKSVEIFKQFWQNRDEKVGENVKQIILATIQHQVPEKCLDQEIMEEFLDLDLSVLGWPTEEYSDYAQRVRMEYQHVSDPDFVNGRIKVLQHLSGLNSQKIYFTAKFQNLYTEQAQKNIEQEIKFLEEFL